MSAPHSRGDENGRGMRPRVLNQMAGQIQSPFRAPKTALLSLSRRDSGLTLDKTLSMFRPLSAGHPARESVAQPVEQLTFNQ